MRRPPVHLPQYDEYGCVMCVTANILYMYYALDHPDVDWVNKQLKRRVGDSQWSESSVLLLLSRGLSVYGISEFSHQAFIEYGGDYLKHFYRDLWHEQWNLVHTPESIAFQQARIAKTEVEIARRNLPRYIDPRKPTTDDIITLIPPNGNCVVDLAVRYKKDPITHAVLVHESEYEGRFLKIYDPSSNHRTLYTMSTEEFGEDAWDGLWLNAWWRAE